MVADIAPAGTVMVALAEPAAGALLIVLMVQKDSAVWFTRPRH
ncbi:hypothetical protein [Streptomyces sp. RerS4]|nr:hypothetical protein [Streptomyces sp. RerS4]